MSCSCIRFSKICFLLSVIFCAVLLLLIPKFQANWKPRSYPQPHPPSVFNASYRSEVQSQQAESSSVDNLNDVTNHIEPFVKEELIQEWRPHVIDTGRSSLKANSRMNKSPINSWYNGVNHVRPDNVSVKEKLELKDIFIAVKTTRKYHKTRLNLLFQTWISQAQEQAFIFTDWEDPELRHRAGDHMINTNCSAVHTRQALCCKMSVEYDKFLESGQKWFCHVDDDNYVNLQNLLHLLSAFSHSQDVYVGRPSLDHPIEAADHVRNDGSVSMFFIWVIAFSKFNQILALSSYLLILLNGVLSSFLEFGARFPYVTTVQN